MRFENATRKKSEKMCFEHALEKMRKNVQKMRKNANNVKKRLKIQLGRWNSDFFLQV